MFNKLSATIINKINKDTVIAPCLFFGNNLEVLNNQVQVFAHTLLEQLHIPQSYIFTLGDNGEKIKRSEIKQFLEFSHSKPGYRIQIFIIENISRLTPTAANSCLKIFEEPGVYNIFFLTNISESGVMDTILSRTHTIETGGNIINKKDGFFYSLIQNYHMNKNTEIFSYFFRNKVEKHDNIKFLENIFEYAKNTGMYIDLLETLTEDIQSIQQNNVNSRYMVDKYLLKMK